MVKPPKKFKERDALRAVIEMLAQGFPLTSALARLYQETHPSKTQEDLQRWYQEITEAHNSLRADHNKLRAEHDAVRQGVGYAGSREVWAWGAVLPEGTFGEGFGTSSITDTGMGRRTISFTRSAPGNNYALVVTPDRGKVRIESKTTGAFSVSFEEDGEFIDTGFSFVVYANESSPLSSLGDTANRAE